MSADFAPIEEQYSFLANGAIRQIGHSEQDQIRNLLQGHAVQKVSDDHLILDNGTVLKVVPNEGGCACSAGDYDLTHLEGVDNLITGVEFDYDPSGDHDEPYRPDGGHYRIFVLAGDKKVNLLSVEGDDGNGYYGTGFWFLVREVAA